MMKYLVAISTLLLAVHCEDNQYTARRGKSVYFQVQQVRDPLFISTNDVVKFDDVTLNEGNHYNRYSGIFIAPVKGVYQFMANMMDRGTGWHNIVLKREGRELARGATGSADKYGTVTIITIARLEKGDHVWLVNEGNTPVHGRRYSYFMGFLLFQ